MIEPIVLQKGQEIEKIEAEAVENGFILEVCIKTETMQNCCSGWDEKEYVYQGKESINELLADIVKLYKLKLNIE